MPLTNSTCSGCTAVAPDESRLAALNLWDGIDIYSLPSFDLLKMHRLPPIWCNIAVDVDFGPDRSVISGSDCGQVLIWREDKEQPIQQLNHCSIL